MPKPIDPETVRYIKLGEHGKWEAECIKKGTIRIGFNTEKPQRYEWCRQSEWEKFKKKFVGDNISLREASRYTKEVQFFFEDNGKTLWITFHKGLLHWGFLEPKTEPKLYAEGVGTWRRVVGGWNCKDLSGNLLKQTELSTELSNLAKYKGTSCKVHAAASLLQRINGGSVPSKPAAMAAREAVDLAEPPPRQHSTVYRIIRDTDLARRVKALHKNECQICRHIIVLRDGSRYSEAHHIRPLGKPHDGPDTMDNIVCVCPNHHAELDYGARPLTEEDLRTVPGHSVNESYIRYHNEVIRG
jgi:hypothetical protein